METPFFPEWRGRLAALGRRTVQQLRQLTLQQLDPHLGGLLPVHQLSQADEGLFSRERIFTLRLTVESFLWQRLKPRTSCREVVRQVLALFRLHDQGSVGEDTGAYIQARLKLPEAHLWNLLNATAQAAQRRVPAPRAAGAATSWRAAANAACSTAASPMWLASSNTSLALTSALSPSVRSRCSSTNCW